MLTDLPKKHRKILIPRTSPRKVAEDGCFPRKRIPINVVFKYLYRDASNYKLHGEAVFTNHTFMPIGEIEKQIHSCLKDGEFFIAQQVNIEERFFDVLYDDGHPWHEFDRLGITTEPVFDLENWNQHRYKRDIAEFIADMEKARRAGWDEMNVRPDVARMQERQKAELNKAFEKGNDILA